jgi:hypothetical protein
VSLIVKAKGPSGPAKIRPENAKHALSLVRYLRTIGYQAWIEDKDGKEIEETVLAARCNGQILKHSNPHPENEERVTL